MNNHTGRHDPWVTFGMALSATSAAVSSFDGLRSLAVAAGWPLLLAPLLPLTVDAYAMTATRVWLSKATGSLRARRFARSNAVGAILLSLAGNATWHLIAARLVAISWPVVLGVGSVPALVLGLVSHLAVLRGQVDGSPVEAAVRTPAPITSSPAAAQLKAPSSNAIVRLPDNELLAAARAADAAWRAEHDGRPINRDALRRVLRVSGERASAVLRELRAAQATTSEQINGQPTT